MGFLDDAFDFITDSLGSLADLIGDKIMTAISNFIGMCLYFLTKALMWFVWVLQEMFNVFSGTSKVQYDGEYKYLIDVFFQNKSVNNVYWAMALLGITFVIVFTAIAVLRKTFDINDKRQNQSMGSILTAMFKSVLTMLVLSLALSAAINLTNLTINRIGYIFDNADSFSQEKEIHFTDEQYATMARVYKTIGNYSLNPSYTSRYNLNSCYNDIRSDLNYLEQQGVFEMVYITKKDGKEIDTWQSALQELVYATDSSRELKMDVYYSEVSDALLHIMSILRTNANFFPISDYQNGYTVTNGVSLDRILFLSGTVSAAKNSKYNENPYITDGLRGAFYTGEKSIYSYDDVTGAFEIGITGINYIFIWALTYFTIRNLYRCIFGCVMRVFNMISLYIVAPLAISTMPLDEGEKFKQWTMAMTIQAFGILGTIIPMRLVILFAPIIMSPKLALFESPLLNFAAKILMIVGGLEAVEGFGHMVTGILANNVSMAALNSGDRAKDLGNAAFAGTKSFVKGAPGFAWGATKTVAKGAGYAVAGAGIAAAGVAAAGLGVAGLAAAGVGAGAYYGAKGIAHGINSLRSNPSDSSLGGSVGSSLGGMSGSSFSGGDVGGNTGSSIGMTDLNSKLGQSGELPGDASNFSNLSNMSNVGNMSGTANLGSNLSGNLSPTSASVPKKAPPPLGTNLANPQTGIKKNGKK